MGLRRGLRRGRLPVFRAHVPRLVAGPGRRCGERSGARTRAAGRQPRRLAVPLRRVDDVRGPDEGAPAAALAALPGPRLGVLAAVPLDLHAPGGRGPGEPPQRGPPARAGRAGDGLPRGRQGHRQALLRALPAAALRTRRVRRDRAADRGADRPRRRRRCRGDLPQDRREPHAREAHRGAVRAADADLPVARAARPGAAAVAVAHRVLRADRPRPATAPTPPTIPGPCSTSPSACATRSRPRSTRTWSSGAGRFGDPRRCGYHEDRPGPVNGVCSSRRNCRLASRALGYPDPERR